MLFEQPKQGLQLALVNQAAIGGDAARFYSDRSADLNAKVLAADEMQHLFDGLATAGLFDHALASPLQNATYRFTVKAGADSWVWSRTVSTPPEEAQKFGTAIEMFLGVYRQTESFHVGRGGGGSYLQDEQQRLRDENQEVVERRQGER